MLAQVREYWQPESGQWAPGKKGVALSPDALKDLADSATTITAALPAGATTAPPPQRKQQQQSKAAAQGGGVGGGAGAGAAAAEGGADFVELGGKKRARINVFKGTKVREAGRCKRGGRKTAVSHPSLQSSLVGGSLLRRTFAPLHSDRPVHCPLLVSLFN